MKNPSCEQTVSSSSTPFPTDANKEMGGERQPPAAAAVTVSKVLDDDDLLIEILLRVGFPTTLVCAALVCKRWLGHASDRAFLRRFRELHPPRLLGFYIDDFDLPPGLTSVLSQCCLSPQSLLLSSAVQASNWKPTMPGLLQSRTARTAASSSPCTMAEAETQPECTACCAPREIYPTSHNSHALDSSVTALSNKFFPKKKGMACPTTTCMWSLAGAQKQNLSYTYICCKMVPDGRIISWT
ncbi:hypothetical protein VPH35_099485 [Triticum aestivum]|uniref:F-box domain-containing protein n=1 Tax=Aegilops tauschii subsp. strangulata TaxID=200361 RepID=A0A453LL02_AEGTS|nr:uncharacterized protein LOC123122565 isoform X1 [Triticum aestivum]